MTNERIYLSPPDMAPGSDEALQKVLASNWIAPVGPTLNEFESRFSELVAGRACCAVSSGTAAIHLALQLAGIGKGDVVICPSLTFVASVNPVLYLGAEPVFVDSDPDSWCLDPVLFEAAISDLKAKGKHPKACIPVHIFGQSSDMTAIGQICNEHGIELIEDAAEALGASWKGKPVGSTGRFGCFSLNGNKIITASSGGVLVGDEADIEQARKLKNHSPEHLPFYHHEKPGYNYQFSNVLAALALAQLPTLNEKVEKRRSIFASYQSELSHIPGITFMPEADVESSTRWLSCMLMNPDVTGKRPEELRLVLEQHNIESRRIWKPMHLQPLFQQANMYSNGTSNLLFDQGLCLPSGSGMSAQQQDRVIQVIVNFLRS